ncbi:hypothetical protein RHS04_00389 [Rhizoctonia solani]|uniref:Uncharacterized protein n=1 Tax=Rhizoctonia solani TaxID=456999 RepID=A0A8H7HGY0_9AGAM|nr:hypothetical protein RHS04_00389 [Rhizoctonia solani]
MSNNLSREPSPQNAGTASGESIGDLTERPLSLALQAPEHLSRQVLEVLQLPNSIETHLLASNDSVPHFSAPPVNLADTANTPPQPQPAPPPFARPAPMFAPEIQEATNTTTEVLSAPVVMIRVEFEQNSGSQHKGTVVDSIQLPSKMPAVEFRTTVIELMELDVETARLTYSITGQVGKPITYAFNTLSQVEDAKQKVLSAIARARSKQKGLLIKNADPVPKIDPQANLELVNPKVLTPSASAVVKTSPVKPKPKKIAMVQEKAVALTETVEALRGLYSCHHCSAFCYICPRTGKHIRLTHEMITLWAKQCIQTPEIVTLSRPPNHRSFDRSRGVKPTFGPKSEPGSSAKLPINVDLKTPPPDTTKLLNLVKFKSIKKSVSQSPSIIIISSDSDSTAMDSNNNMSDIETVDSDAELPQPEDLLHNLASTSSLHGRLLLALLDELDEHFPGHNFITYAELFDRLEVRYVCDLAEHDLTWLLTLTSMEEPSAMILMGAALSEQMMYPLGLGSSKGKGKSKF